MKKNISYLLIIALMVTSIAGIPFFYEESYAHAAEETLNPIRYHLDMGVYVVAKADGKWVDGIPYKTVQSYTPNALKFPSEIKVSRIMSLSQAKSEGIDIWNEKYFTHNIPLKSGEKPFDAYRNLYESYISPSMTNYNIILNKGNKLQFSLKAQLKTQSDYDYNLIKEYDARVKKTQTVQQVVVKDNKTATAIKNLEAEAAKLYKIIQNAHSTGYTEPEKKAHDRYMVIKRQLSALKAKPNYTTIDKVIESYKLDQKSFIDEVYKFWGGPEGLKNVNGNMYTMMQNMEKGNINLNDEYYLVFIPTVIEYKVIDIYKEKSQVTPPADTKGGCTDVIQWSEIKTHTYKCSGCKTRADGSKYCPGHTCKHVYTYQAKLKSTAVLRAVKPNGNNTTFKSGYGFTVDVKNTVEVKQISNGGACGKSLSKKNEKVPVPPLTAEVKTNWTVKNKEKKTAQPMTVKLAKSSSTTTTSHFVTAANPVSHYKNAQIYTDVALKGAKKKPIKHTVTVYIYGGGVNGVQFCKSIPLAFTINGNMYEDDWTVDGKM